MAAGAPSGSAPGVGADVQIVPDAELTGLNTFGLPARAARLVRVRHADQVQALIGEAGWAVRPRLVLGGGSNLVLSADFAGTVLKVDIPGRRLLRSTQEAWIVEAGAGENWHDFVRWTLAQGWSGLENLALIPGTVGAAPVQNIGAYGLELVDRFDSLDAIDLDSGACRCFAVHDCAFGYRDSVFKRNPGKWLVTAVRFRLPRPWQPVTRYADVARELETRGVATPSALDISDAVIAIRRRKLPDPAEIGNAGSFFKNPLVPEVQAEALRAAHPGLPVYPGGQDGLLKLSAAWLIEQAGLKGYRDGDAGIAAQHALVLVNHGHATGAQLLAVARTVIDTVRTRFGITLEPEPRILGAAM